MAVKTSVIPSMRQVYSAAYASIPDGSEGDLAFATDRDTLYRWTSGVWIAVSGKPLMLSHVASDVLRHSFDEENNTNKLSYTKITEITLEDRVDACRIKFDLKTFHVAGLATARLYKNGVAIGTEQTEGAGGYVTKSEDFAAANFEKGDKIQVYAKTDDANISALVENLRLYYDVDFQGHTNEAVKTLDLCLYEYQAITATGDATDPTNINDDNTVTPVVFDVINEYVEFDFVTERQINSWRHFEAAGGNGDGTYKIEYWDGSGWLPWVASFTTAHSGDWTSVSTETTVITTKIRLIATALDTAGAVENYTSELEVYYA